ncbi:hypothetical protein SAMD00019534_043120, partial [Acytostelium subglobosum LB1]|uniref:hypothetical protein n=1 Tax=Acytostelium subglobosum LB1 TaxID=1410327 RepID=UPI000644B9BC
MSTNTNNLRNYDSQIAGHTEDTPGTEGLPPFLMSSDGYVYKPVPGKRGKKEVDFYQQTVSTLHQQTIHQFLAKFDKVIQVNDIEYMGLEDLTYPYHKDSVCVADIKMGMRTYDSTATPEKIKYEEHKSVNTTTSSLGFRFCGAKLHHPETHEILRLDKNWGKDMTKENMLKDGLERVFKCGGQGVVLAFIERLEVLLDWFKNQNRSMAFYSSSLLFIYGKVRDGSQQDVTTMISQDTGITIKMIDFAHVDHLTGPSTTQQLCLDTSYIHGLENLINLMKQL